MTSRERVVAALNFEKGDRLPLDLGGMRSTGISCFAYPRLIKELGLPPRPPKIYDSGQMLAIPENDLLEALGVDVAFAEVGSGGFNSNIMDDGIWHRYDFNGRLDALVRDDPARYSADADGTIRIGDSMMPPQSYVFSPEHGGQPISDDLPEIDLDALEEWLSGQLLTDSDVRKIAEQVKKLRAHTGRALMLSLPAHSGIAIGGFFGIGIFPMICMLRPETVERAHRLIVDTACANARKLLPAIKDDFEILLAAADDWGTQNSLLASPDVYKTLFKPFYRDFNDAVHASAPGIKTFFHTCGAVYPLLEEFIESGFDIINPVQWCAGDAPPEQWKETCRNRAVLWGGGVNTQTTLPLGTAGEVEAEVKRVCRTLGDGGGYVFAAIHNILAEIEPEKIIAMYRAAATIRF